MNKVFPILILSIILLAPLGFVLALTEASDCQEYCSDPYDPITGLGEYFEPAGVICICSPTSITTIDELIDSITNWIFWIAVILGPAMIAIGAIMFMTSAGNPDRVKKATNMVKWTIIGLTIILAGKAIIALIRYFLGV